MASGASFRFAGAQLRQTVASSNGAVLATAPPVALTTFVGREAELAELRGWLREARLITLIGAGGTGKTCLAADLAAAVAQPNECPTWFVPLDRCHESELVATAVAAAIGIREEPRRSPVEILVARMRDSKGLVVLDNCEHVLSAAASVTEALLLGCPRLRVLTTSRAVLALPGELTWRVPCWRCRLRRSLARRRWKAWRR